MIVKPRLLVRLIGRALNPFNSTAGYVVPHVLVAALIGGILTLSGVFAYHHFHPPKVAGGFKRSAPPPAVVLRGGFVPQSVTLPIVRIHDQGADSSCVAQTVSTIAEIVSKESGHPKAYSPGWIWNRWNGGNPNNGMTYPQGFGTFQYQGDAPLSFFRADGTLNDYWWSIPSSASREASKSRVSSYHSVALWDRPTIERELAAGHPLAFGASWFDSWYSHWQDCSPLPTQYGGYEFDHSTTIYGYTPYGVRIVNSWGPSWGCSGTTILSWANLSYAHYSDGTAAEIIASTPAFVFPKPKTFPVKKWRAYTHKHHLKNVPYGSHGKIAHGASLWWKFGPSKAGPVISAEQYFPKAKGRRYPYMSQRFQNFRLWWWIHKPWVKWLRVRQIT